MAGGAIAAWRGGDLTMIDLGNSGIGRFCWVDLAATDAARATDFYGQVFGWASREQLKVAAATSNEALAKLPGKVQWMQSYVVDDKTFCIYLADSEASVQEHARLSGFPANKVTEVRTIIDPMTALS